MTLVRLWRDVRSRRDLLQNLVRRDLVERYQRSWRGIILALAWPALATAVFTLLFSRLVPRGGMYPLHVFVGFLAFDWFARTAALSTDVLRGHASLIGRVPFPIVIVPVATCIATAVHFAVGLLFAIVANVLFGTGAHATLALVPILVLVQLAWNVGCALLLSVAGVLFRDFAQLVALGTGLLFYATPIFYSPDIVPWPAVREALGWNPLYVAIESLRVTILDGRAPPLGPSAYGFACAAIALCAGTALFERSRYSVVERLG